MVEIKRHRNGTPNKKWGKKLIYRYIKEYFDIAARSKATTDYYGDFCINDMSDTKATVHRNAPELNRVSKSLDVICYKIINTIFAYDLKLTRSYREGSSIFGRQSLDSFISTTVGPFIIDIGIYTPFVTFRIHVQYPVTTKFDDKLTPSEIEDLTGIKVEQESMDNDSVYHSNIQNIFNLGFQSAFNQYVENRFTKRISSNVNLIASIKCNKTLSDVHASYAKFLCHIDENSSDMLLRTHTYIEDRLPYAMQFFREVVKDNAKPSRESVAVIMNLMHIALSKSELIDFMTRWHLK